MKGLTRLITSVERRPARTFAAIGLLFAALYTSTHAFFPRAHGRVVNGDAIQYYVYLQSLAVDGDLDFANEYRALYGGDDATENVWLTTTTPIGRSPNVMSVGPAILWAPAFFVVWVVVLMTRLVRRRDAARRPRRAVPDLGGCRRHRLCDRRAVSLP